MSMSKTIQKEYRRLRARKFATSTALEAAKIIVRFRAHEERGVARIRHVEDEEPYLFGDAEDEDDTRRRIAQHGLFGLVAEVKCPCCEDWHHLDSCWGFVGDDLEDNGTDHEMMRTLTEACETAGETTCERCRRLTEKLVPQIRAALLAAGEL